MRKGLLFKLIACYLSLLAISAPIFGISQGITVVVSPTYVTLAPGADKRIAVQVTGTPNTGVYWSVNGVIGGNSTLGTVDSSGKYVAPMIPPPNGTVIVKATSVVTWTAYGSCQVVITKPSPTVAIPTLSSVVPNQVILGPISLTVNGSKFIPGAQILWNGSPLTTSYVSSAQLKATGTATQIGNAGVTVSNPGQPTVSNSVTVKVLSGLAVSVTPLSAGVQTGATQQFQATVSNSQNQAVTWKVNNTVGGDPAYGTIDANGLFTAPSAIPLAGQATITAVSQVDNTTQGSASVTFVDPLNITYGRFLDQSTFGPTPQLMAHIHQTGIQGFLDEQFLMPESPLPTAQTATTNGNVDAFFNNALSGQDQCDSEPFLR